MDCNLCLQDHTFCSIVPLLEKIEVTFAICLESWNMLGYAEDRYGAIRALEICVSFLISFYSVGLFLCCNLMVKLERNQRRFLRDGTNC